MRCAYSLPACPGHIVNGFRVFSLVRTTSLARGAK
jgi:hypothetical protein